MLLAFDPAQNPLMAVLSVPAIYIAAVAVGRWLKRRQKVPLGFAYQLLCIVLAVWLPLHVYVRLHPAVPPTVFNLLKQLNALAALLGMFFLIALVRRYFWQLWFEHKYRVRAPKFLSDLGALILFAVAVIYVISLEQGRPITGIAVGSTLVAAIIGLALQDLLGNIIAGIALEIGKPFKTGDWLVFENRHMEVIEVNWRSTRLRTNDDTHLDVPNKTIAGSTITNLTLLTRHHAIRIQVGFEYAAPPNLVKDRIKKAVSQVRGVLAAPAPKVFLKSFGDSALIYEIKFWIEDETQYNDILDAVHTHVWYEAQRSQFRIPYPVRTLHIDRQYGRRDDSAIETARACVRRQPILRVLDEAQTEKLLRQARILRFGRGERVIEQGAEGRSMFIVIEGEADVVVRASGQETTVATMQGGDYFGEMSLLTGEPRSATVIARADCELLEIKKEVLAEILQENAELLEKLGQILAQRRLENEGVLASSANAAHLQSKKKEYAEGFLKRLSSFFEL